LKMKDQAMLYIALFLFGFVLLAAALFYFFKTSELRDQLRQSTEAWQEREAAYTSELNKLEKLRHIPNVIEKAQKMKEQVESKLTEAQVRADEILERAVEEAQDQSKKLRGEAEKHLAEAKEALRVAKVQAQNFLDEAERQAKEQVHKDRRAAKEKREKAEAELSMATEYAQRIRMRAESRAKEIAGEAFEAKGRLKDYQAALEAIKNKLNKYEGVYQVPLTHMLDELAEEFGFSKAGAKLKLARQRTKLMQRDGVAATCGYPEGWKRDYALKFVLGTFNGKVDTILSRVRPGNQARLSQEIKDAYALVNNDGKVYKKARIQEEYLDSRLEELKWAVAVQKLKEQKREEQRAIRERIREEQRAKKEIERAIKQAERDEEIASKAIENLRNQFEQASEAERAKLEVQLAELNAKLAEAEERGRRAISMAQQTKQGNVYIISNIGSFGDNVYKIGLTRRLDPTERIRELGNASVPFPFDVHAMIASEDAPALETALHRRFLERQVNKMNNRKEFFKVDLTELRQILDQLGIEANWTLEAEATQYRETLALEQAMKTDMDLKKKWIEEQERVVFDDETPEEAEEELEEVEA
jgi:Meiotically Up-regulated Gene 113 (MUG113) protein/uncharacterized protein DUF4041